MQNKIAGFLICIKNYVWMLRWFFLFLYIFYKEYIYISMLYFYSYKDISEIF